MSSSPTTPEGPGEVMPADVVVARAIKAHTRALLVILAAPLVLAGLGAAALSLAGPYGSDPPAIAGVTMIAQGQVLGLIAAGLVGKGLADLLRRSGTPGSTDARRLAASGTAGRVLSRTMNQLATMVKVILVAAVVGIVVWAAIDLSALAGAVVGAVLVAQVAVVVALARVGVLHRTARSLPGP